MFIKFDNYGNGIKLTDVVPGKDMTNFTIKQNSDGSWDVVGSVPAIPVIPVEYEALNDWVQYDRQIVCFLKNSMIKTPDGYIPIQAIRENDLVITVENGHETTSKVTWLAHAVHKTGKSSYPDVAGYPVRIKKNAIDMNVPFDDLLVTPEHCLFLDGKFIPARMLVNGKNIVYDMNYDEYDYYHIETEKHSVILANNLPTESYLDTGNKAEFGLLSSHRVWNTDSFALLDTSVEFVKPVYDRIVENYTKEYDCKNISLLCDNGEQIKEFSQEENIISFTIPQEVKKVTIKSDVFRPCDTIGAYVDDRRVLGIVIQNIEVKMGDIKLPVSKGQGWYHEENTTSQWTNGNADILLTDASIHADRKLFIKLG